MTEQEMQLALQEFTGVQGVCDGYCCYSPDGKSIAMCADIRKECDAWLASMPMNSPYKTWQVKPFLRYPRYLVDHDAAVGALSHFASTQSSAKVAKFVWTLFCNANPNAWRPPGDCEITSTNGGHTQAESFAYNSSNMVAACCASPTEICTAICMVLWQERFE